MAGYIRGWHGVKSSALADDDDDDDDDDYNYDGIKQQMKGVIQDARIFPVHFKDSVYT
jgi:hypothetical protein